MTQATPLKPASGETENLVKESGNRQSPLRVVCSAAWIVTEIGPEKAANRVTEIDLEKAANRATEIDHVKVVNCVMETVRVNVSGAAKATQRSPAIACFLLRRRRILSCRSC